MLFVHIATLALATTAFAASGCGGSSDAKTTAATTPTTTSTPVTTPEPVIAAVKAVSGRPLTHSQWVAKANAICTSLNAELTANPANAKKSIAVAMLQVVAYERSELGQLSKLVPPAADARNWQTFLTDEQQATENTAALAKAAESGKFTVKDPLVTTTNALRTDFMRIARHDGMVECGNPAA